MQTNHTTCGAMGSGFVMPVLIGMVFLGATLLFGMEPLVGRILVPFFGGAAHVWLTSLMFFQAMLLVGYLYAHLCAQRLGRWHLLLLLLPAFAAQERERRPAVEPADVLLDQVDLAGRHVEQGEDR